MTGALAIVAVGLALWAALAIWGPIPRYVGGHNVR